VNTEALVAPDAAQDRPQVEKLLDRLNEPGVAASLNVLLDNIELLAVIVAGMDGLARKGELIGDTLAEVYGQMRAAGRASGLDPVVTTRQLATVIPTLAEASPAINRVLESPIVEPEPIEVLSEAAVALVDGLRAAESKATTLGLRGVMTATRDPDVRRALGFVVEVARVFGRDLARGRRFSASSRNETPERAR